MGLLVSLKILKEIIILSIKTHNHQDCGFFVCKIPRYGRMVHYRLSGKQKLFNNNTPVFTGVLLLL